MSSSRCWAENGLADAKFDFHHRIDVTPDVDRARRRRELALAQDADPGGPGAVREQPLRRRHFWTPLSCDLAHPVAGSDCVDRIRILDQTGWNLVRWVTYW